MRVHWYYPRPSQRQLKLLNEISTYNKSAIRIWENKFRKDRTFRVEKKAELKICRKLIQINWAHLVFRANGKRNRRTIISLFYRMEK